MSLRLLDQTVVRLKQLGISIPWSESDLMTITCPHPRLTIEDVSRWIEACVEGLYYRQVQGWDEGQAQVTSIRTSTSGALPWRDHASRHLRDGDTILIDCQLAISNLLRATQPYFTDADLQQIRARLRFDLADRVVCDCGPRWFSGLVVGTAVVSSGDISPYVVETDALPGFPSGMVSVPSDTDQICTQEVCFDPSNQLHLVQAAAQLIKESDRASLRFAVGDRVVVRIRNSAEDGLENWVQGTVSSLWPAVGGATAWQVGDVSGEFPDAVPYRIDLGGGGWVYCHRDHFTLIRREGWQPRTRAKGISKRIEVVRAADGSLEEIDHKTERRQPLSW